MASIIRTAGLCALLPICSSFAAAQTTGILRGSIVDPSGAAVPNTGIMITGPNSTTKAVESDGSGGFSFPGLAPGQYSVRATAKGFDTYQITLDVAAGRVSSLEIHLTVALDRQEVTVAESQQTQVAVDPAQNASALVVNEKDLDALSDNPDDLEADLLALAGPSVGPTGGQIFIDGFSNGQLPPKESIREVRINSNPFSAEYDRPGSARIEVITKPGADRLRGGASMSLADSALNARNPFSTTKPPTQMRQFDGNLGRPLGKKTSFTFDGTHQKQDSTALVNADILDSSFQQQHVNQIVQTPGTRTFLSPRVDRQLTSNVTLQGRYTYNGGTNDHNNVGGFALPSRGTNLDFTQHGTQLTETTVIGTRMVNETRFQYTRLHVNNAGDSTVPAINVLGAFSGGGASFSHNYYFHKTLEFQNNTSYIRGRHLVKFGVRVRRQAQDNYSTSNYNGSFTFTSLTAYALTLQGVAQGLTMDQIRSQGGGASQYSVAGGTPLSRVDQIDTAPYVQDDFRIAPNFTVSTGLRYEIQTNIGDRRAWAPRAGIAWGIGKGQGGTRPPKTVLRLGYGLFYDRIEVALTLQALRQNGVTQQDFLVTAPGFFANPPLLGQLVANRQPKLIQLKDSSLQAPQILQSAASLERQLPRNMTLSISYTNSRGVHQLRSRNINAPLPGSGFYPYGDAGQRYLYESSALFKQSQITVNISARVNKRISLAGYYTYNHASSNSDGFNSFPANNYDLSGEWGRAAYDTRHRIQLSGNLLLPFKIQLAPNISANSAPAVNITNGEDTNGDTSFNDRPAFATVPADPAHGVIATPWGVFNKEPVRNPASGAVIIPRNYGFGYGNVNINGRISRMWTFPSRGVEHDRSSGGNGSAAAAGRYSLTASIQARNWINHVNPSSPVANLSSPFLGQALNLQSGSTANRRIELNLRFNF